VLEAKNLGKTFPDGREVLAGVSLSIGRGQTLAVVGPSGCGKTTLLYMLCGLAAPSTGEVKLNGRPVAGCTPEVSIILQDYGLLPWKSVLDNVALGLKVQGVPKAEREDRARALIAEMGLAGRERDYPGNLSGGEQQRVAIARAFALEPSVLLMDEPFSSLDAITREKLQGILLAAWREREVPYVLVTHSVDEAVFLGGRILVMGGCPARVIADVENPGFAENGRREHKDYFETTRKIRELLETGGRA
jgi:NitT/TauT family transport system ATP-binding protein